MNLNETQSTNHRGVLQQKLTNAILWGSWIKIRSPWKIPDVSNGFLMPTLAVPQQWEVERRVQAHPLAVLSIYKLLIWCYLRPRVGDEMDEGKLGQHTRQFWLVIMLVQLSARNIRYKESRQPLTKVKEVKEVKEETINLIVTVTLVLWRWSWWWSSLTVMIVMMLVIREAGGEGGGSGGRRGRGQGARGGGEEKEKERKAKKRTILIHCALLCLLE